MKIENPIPPLPVGYKLASNTVLHLLGQGEFGATYVVTDVRADGNVSVIKESLPTGLAYREGSTQQVLPMEATGEGVEKLRAAQEAFTAEAKALETMHHPSVVAVSRVFSALGTTYITMEYLRGITMAEWSEKNGAPTKQQLVYLLTCLLSALKYLHAHGVSHGDIREEHVRFRENGVPVLIDFGISRKTIQASTGTAEISAMEKYQQDIFALGAMARRLITHEKTATGSRTAPLAKNSKLAGTYGRSLLAGIDRAMNPNKGKGWSNAEEWLDAVKGRLFTAPTRKLFHKIAIGVAAVGTVGLLSYQLVQWCGAPETETAASTEPTTEEKAKKAYEEGMAFLNKGTPEPERAIPLLEQAAGLGYADAKWVLVECYRPDGSATSDNGKYFHWAQESAKTGKAEAHYIVATCYLEGIGTKPDAEAAIPHLIKAAEAGIADAQYDLGVLFTEEDTPHYNKEKAEFWLIKAAEQNSLKAQLKLARLYHEAKIGYSQTSRSDAITWYSKVASNTATDAETRFIVALANYNIGLVYWEMNGNEENRSKAAEAFKKAAKSGIPEASYRLGIEILKGSIRGEHKEAEAYLQQAAVAEVVFPVLTDLTAYARIEGDTESMAYLQHMASRRTAEARLALANLYLTGSSDVRNERKAAFHFLQAAKNGDKEAACSLARIWLSGCREGISEEEIRAQLEKAAATTPRAKLYMAILPGTPREESVKILDELRGTSVEKGVRADAYAYLGLMEKELKNAKAYYQSATQNGSPLGKAMLSYTNLMEGATGNTAADSLRMLASEAGSNEPYRYVLRAALGEVYLTGKGETKNAEHGKKLLEEAAAAGVPDAMLKLSRHYISGQFTDKDANRAYELAKAYNAACNGKENKETAVLLDGIASMYAKGEGMEQKDEEKAKQCWTEAMEADPDNADIKAHYDAVFNPKPAPSSSKTSGKQQKNKQGNNKNNKKRR